MELDRRTIDRFQRTVWDYFTAYGRTLPWRQPDAGSIFDPYKILVSEIMLQQTQVSRVVPRYQRFIAIYPDVMSLAAASLADVLGEWAGLGYNRRAKYLWQAAQKIAEAGGQYPQTVRELTQLPGVGANTAGALAAYAYDEPVVFIETNIRTVYIHHFFAGQNSVADADLKPYIEQTMPERDIRRWYWALMDYGTHLKATTGNSSARSKHYAKQSPLEGSRRQIRGQVLAELRQRPNTRMMLSKVIADERLTGVLIDLKNENLISLRGGRYYLG